MNLEEGLVTQENLDEAIKLLYKSRPAKAAALLGLLDPENPISLAPKVEASEEALNEKLSAMAGPANASPAISKLPGEIKYQSGDAPDHHKLKGPGQLDKLPPPSDTVSIAKGQGIDDGGVAKFKYSSHSKSAMSDQEYLMYQAGLGPMMEDTGDPTITPTQMATFGGGAATITAANRMRAKNVAARELKNVRQNYLNAVRENALSKQQLKNLNLELKLRGVSPKLQYAPSVGVADAYIAKAEKDLGSKILKNRYKGFMPAIAAGLLGTLVYNKLNEV